MSAVFNFIRWIEASKAGREENKDYFGCVRFEMGIIYYAELSSKLLVLSV